MIARLRRSLRDSAMACGALPGRSLAEREREFHVLAVDAVAVLEQRGVERLRDARARVRRTGRAASRASRTPRPAAAPRARPSRPSRCRPRTRRSPIEIAPARDALRRELARQHARGSARRARAPRRPRRGCSRTGAPCARASRASPRAACRNRPCRAAAASGAGTSRSRPRPSAPARCPKQRTRSSGSAGTSAGSGSQPLREPEDLRPGRARGLVLVHRDRRVAVSGPREQLVVVRARGLRDARERNPLGVEDPLRGLAPRPRARPW